MHKVVQDLKYLQYTLFHPFDAFYEIKWRDKGNMFIATFIILAYGIAMILNEQYTGFVMNQVPQHEINSLATLVITVVPILLFVVSNWSVATLYNGKGRIKDLYLVMGYSLFPLLVVTLISTGLSNIIILEEVTLLYAFNGMGLIWFLYLAFCGVTTVHEYSAKESVMTIFSTAASALIIIFLCVLYFSLMEQFVSFVTTIGEELIRRW